jgi:hypothetical protein
MPLVGTILSAKDSDIEPRIDENKCEPSRTAFNSDDFPAPVASVKCKLIFFRTTSRNYFTPAHCN